MALSRTAWRVRPRRVALRVGVLSFLVLALIVVTPAPLASQLAPGSFPQADARAGLGGAAPEPGPLGTPDTEPLMVPLIVHQALASDLPGTDQPGAVATIGLPFSVRDAVAVVAGRPALQVEGAQEWQARVTGIWPDGSVRWALLDVQVDVPAGQKVPLVVRRGGGTSAGAPVASMLEGGLAPQIVIDTGRLRARIDTQFPARLASVLVDGVLIAASAGADDGVIATTPDGQPLRPGPSTRAVLEVTGPALAVVRVEGPLVDPQGQSALDFTMRLTARVGRPDLELTLTARNASIERWTHAEIGSLAYVLPTSPGAAPGVRIAGASRVWTAPLSAGQQASLHVAQTSKKVEGLESVLYRPHLPKVAPGTSGTALVQQGHRVVVGGVELNPFGDPGDHPEAPWLTLSGSQGGATAVLRHGAWNYPAVLSGDAGGRLVLGFFPEQNPAPFVFVHGQHESRTALVSFFAGPAPLDEAALASGLDWPVNGRAADYDHYDQAGVFPYRLVTQAEHNLAYQLMGIDHTVFVPNVDLTATRYLYKGTSGPQNNHARIERLLAGEWMRHGVGGQFVMALDLALYKSEWQIRRSDDFTFTDGLPAPENDDLPHSKDTFGDDQHRYRDGIVLAYHLTGDERFADALFDEAEVLKTIDLWPHERSMVQSLRAQATVARFTGDAELFDLLRERLAYVTPPLLDVDVATSGFGWDSLPGQGDRRYYANSGDLQGEKPPGEHFMARGYISATLAPLGYFVAAEALSGEPLAQAALGRLLDLAWWTRDELFPYHPDPAQRHLVYSYAIGLQQVVAFDQFDFHPILFAMGRAFEATGDVGYLARGIEQIQSFAVHDNGPYDDNLPYLDTRLDCQDFFATWLAWRLAQEP